MGNYALDSMFVERYLKCSFNKEMHYASTSERTRKIENRWSYTLSTLSVISQQMDKSTLPVSSSCITQELRVTASLHVVPRIGRPWKPDLNSIPSEAKPHGPNEEDGIDGYDLLLRRAQTSEQFAAATCLAPGIHIMCYVQPVLVEQEFMQPTGFFDSIEGKTSLANAWRVIRDAVRDGISTRNDGENLTWQQPCLRLLTQVSESLGSAPMSSMIAGLPGSGWSFVPCAPHGNSACFLAAGNNAKDGKVAWFHHQTANWIDKAGAAVAERVSLVS